MDPPDDTQPLDTQVWENLGYKRAGNHRNSLGAAIALDSTEETGHTYQDIPNAQLNLRVEHAQVPRGDDATDTSHVMDSEMVTSPAAFSPTTPGALTENNDGNPGNLPSSTLRTPAPNLNGIFANPGKTIGLSQLFRQTQARSSPAPDSPASEGILGQPSPDFAHHERAMSDSTFTTRSVAKSNVKILSDVGVPGEHYLSLKESEELRARRLTLRGNMSLVSTGGDGHSWLNMGSQPDSPVRDHRFSLAGSLDGKTTESTLLDPGRRKRRKLASPATVIGDVGIITPASHLKRSMALGCNELIGNINAYEYSNDDSDKPSRIVHAKLPHSISKGPSISNKAINSVATTRRTSSPSPQSPSTSDYDSAVLRSQVSATRDQSIRQVMATQSSRTMNHCHTSSASAHGPDTVANSQIDKRLSQVTEDAASPGEQHVSAPVPESSVARPKFVQGLNRVGKVGRARGQPVSSPQDSMPSSPPSIGEMRSTEPSSSRLQKQDISLGYTTDIPDIDKDHEGPPSRILRRVSQSAVKSTPPPPQHDNAHAAAAHRAESSPGAEVQAEIYATPSVSQGEALAEAHFASTTPRRIDDKLYVANETQTVPSERSQIKRQSSRLSNQSSQSGPIRKLADFESHASPRASQLDLPFAALDHNDMIFQDAMMSPKKGRSRKVYGSRRRVLTERQQKGPKSRVVTLDAAESLSTKENLTFRRNISQGDVWASEEPPPDREPPDREPSGSHSPLEALAPERDDLQYNQPGGPLEERSWNAVARSIDETPVVHRSGDEQDDQAGVDSAYGLDNNLHRIFTSGPGEFDFYYPGTIVGVHRGDDRLLIVRLDDGRVLEKQICDVRRLELHVGDKVNVNLKGGVANITWSIREFAVTDNSDALNEGQLKTDILGNSKVVLEVYTRQRSTISASSTETVRIEQVAIKDLYIKHDLWSQFDDRQYLIYTDKSEGNATELPSDAATIPLSLPTTPTARRLRGATVLPDKGFAANGMQGAHCTNSSDSANKNGIFSSMAFAVSYSSNLQREKESLSELIISHGGRILDNGFNELFHLCPPRSKEDEQGSDTDATEGLCLEQCASALGFVALIADTYSRRAKYMQALALNIPCLHGRWISDSVEEQSLKPWGIYSLPAGESVYLGGAIRNRTFSSQIPAEKCKLPVTIATRPKLLEGMSVILVIGKSKKAEERRHAYLFLTCALGAKTVRRVPDLEAAKKALSDTQHDWDWIYVNETWQKADAEIFVMGRAETGRVRKKALKPGKGVRKGVVPQDAANNIHHPIKVVDDEFVIQSLILGALMES